MNPYIVADIGGTNARFGIASEQGVNDVQVFPCNAFESFENVFAAYFETLNNKSIKHAAIAIATHVSDDEVEFTNLPWAFSISRVAKKHGFEKFKVLNDLAASAISIPLLNENQTIKICNNNEVPMSSKALIAAGTGLGMSGLLPTGETWMPVAGEGGHMSLCATTKFEYELLKLLFLKHGYVSAEMVLSGRGLTNLHAAVAKINGEALNDLLPAEIVTKGVSGEDKHCELVLNTYCGFLGSVAGDLALILGAQNGVYIGGGIVNHMRDFFVKNTHFMKHFINKGQKENYMKKIPIHMISDTQIGLLGAYESRKQAYENIGFTWSADSK